MKDFPGVDVARDQIEKRNQGRTKCRPAPPPPPHSAARPLVPDTREYQLQPQPCWDEDWDSAREWWRAEDDEQSEREAPRPWEEREILEEWSLSDEERAEEERQAKRRR